MDSGRCSAAPRLTRGRGQGADPPRTACKNGLRAAERCRNDASTTPLFPPGRHPDPSNPSSFLIPSRQCFGYSLPPDDMAIRNGFHNPPSSTLDSQPTVLRRATPARARATAPPVALHKVSQRQRLFRLRPCSLFPRTTIWKGRDKTSLWLWWGGPGTGGVDGDAASVPDVHALPGPSALRPITGAVSGAIEHLVSRDEAQASSSTEVWSLPSAHFALLPFAPDPQLDRMPKTAAAISLFVATLRWSRCPATPTTTRPRAILNVSKPASVPSTWSLATPGMQGIVALQQTHHLHGPSLHRLILAAVKSGCPRNGDRSQR